MSWKRLLNWKILFLLNFYSNELLNYYILQEHLDCVPKTCNKVGIYLQSSMEYLGDWENTIKKKKMKGESLFCTT